MTQRFNFLSCFRHRLDVGLCFDSFLIVALFTQTTSRRSRTFGRLFYHKWRLTAGAWFGNGTVPQCETALRIATATVEDLTATRPLLLHVTFFTFRTGHTNRFDRLALLAHVRAVRIARAAQKLAVTTKPHLHRLATFLAGFVSQHLFLL